jgi:fumarate hydratase class II
MTQQRIERDSMGEVAVPAQAYYGASTQRAVDNFPVSGEAIPAEVVRALGLLKSACAVANQALGDLSADRAEAIRAAADEVARGELDDQFVVDVFQTGSGTSSNMNANEVIANRASELLGGQRGCRLVHPNDHVNAGQSSNDVFPSAVHLAAVEAVERRLLPALERLRVALAAKAAELDDVVKPGRTHLMDATPVTLGQELGGYARQAELGAARVRDVLPRLFELPLGGTAVGTGLNARPEMAGLAIEQLHATTGLTGLVEASDHFEAQGGRDALVELSASCKVVAVSLSKVANDVRLLGSGPRAGIGEVAIPAVQPGSSIMPAKVNPVIAESVLQVCAQVIGNDAAATTAGMNGHLELNVAIPLLARTVLESVRLLAASADNFARQCVEGLEANRERASELAEKSLAAVTALVPALGYDTSAELAKKALAQNRPLREVVKEAGVLADAEVDRILDLAAMTRGGIV